MPRSASHRPPGVANDRRRPRIEIKGVLSAARAAGVAPGTRAPPQSVAREAPTPRIGDDRDRGRDERDRAGPATAQRAARMERHAEIDPKYPGGVGRRRVPCAARDQPERHGTHPRRAGRLDLRPDPLGHPAVGVRGAGVAVVRVHGLARPGAQRARGSGAVGAPGRRGGVRGAPPRAPDRFPPVHGGAPAVPEKRARAAHVRVLPGHGDEHLRGHRGRGHADRGTPRDGRAPRGGSSPRAHRGRCASREPAGPDPAALPVQHAQRPRGAGAPRGRSRGGSRDR